MTKPTIAARQPAEVTLEAGKTYFWCSCGLSLNQPFCDGAHAGTGFSPVRFTAQNTDTYYLCQCKLTDESPLCDGAHKVFGQTWDGT